MRSYRVLMILFFACGVPATLLGQAERVFTNHQLAFQYGFSIRALVEFSLQKNRQKPVFRISSDLGLGSNVLARGLYFTINTEVQLYNGGLGSKRREGHTKPGFTIDLISAFTLTTGVQNYLTKDSIIVIPQRNIPLYYFSNFAYPALQNPYNYSISAGTNFIFTFDKHKTKQRVGFLNLHFNRVQFSYYNDGGAPFDETFLGDSRDRFYSGGALFSYHGKPGADIHLVEVGFNKFTGYTKNAFEVSNKLDLAFVNYNNPEQKFYNKSRWNLVIANPEKGFGLHINRYNYTPWDVQHLIHFSIFNSYHLVPYEDYFSAGGFYIHNYNNVGLR